MPLPRYNRIRMNYEVTTVSFSWRLPDDTRTTVSFSAEAKGHDDVRDRLIIVLGQLQTPLADGLDTTTQSLIQSLTGKWVQIPTEARHGMVLPLKYETLTGRIRFFYEVDPRTIVKPPKKTLP